MIYKSVDVSWKQTGKILDIFKSAVDILLFWIQINVFLVFVPLEV